MACKASKRVYIQCDILRVNHDIISCLNNNYFNSSFPFLIHRSFCQSHGPVLWCTQTERSAWMAELISSGESPYFVG